MKKISFLILAVLLVAVPDIQAAEVKNLVNGQRGSQAFARYDLAGRVGEKEAEVTVFIELGGERYPADKLSLKGAFGPKVKVGGGKEIIWDVLADLPGGYEGDIVWDVEASKQKDIPATSDSIYLKGLERFRAGDMPAARDIFTKFLEQYPHNDLVADAHYWIGETHFSEKNYEPAILAFQDVIKNYPQKDKVPVAMLKQAMAFKAINDTKSFKYLLKKLGRDFPKSDEAKKANAILKEIE